jgi:uncharacterized protein (DUF58 family)
MDLVSRLLEPATTARLERLVLLARRVRPSRKRSRALRLPGRGLEPGSRREYQPGDDTRQVDWPAYARLERLLIKVQEELPEPRLDLLLDGSGSMSAGEPTPLLRACLASAALAAVAVARDVRVVVWWGGAPRSRHELRRPGQLVGLLRFLDRLTGQGIGELAATSGQAVGLIRHAGAALVLSDGLSPELVTAAQRLRGRGCDTRVVLVEPRHELDATRGADFAAGGLAELVDAETGARILRPLGPVALDEARAMRAARIAAQVRALEAAGIATLALPPADPFEAVAQNLLRA